MLGGLLLGCEPEKEVVEVDPSIFDPTEESFLTWQELMMTSLDDEVYPDMQSERYDQEV